MGYKHLSITEFLFERGSLISVFGSFGTGKTAIALEVANDLDGIFISSTGNEYKGRVKGKWRSKFVDVTTSYELFVAIVESVKSDPNVIVIDAINRFYRTERKYKQLLMMLNILESARGRVLLTWEMSTNNKVSGHKIMTFYSKDVFRATGRYLIGNGKRCRYVINSHGVMGCI